MEMIENVGKVAAERSDVVLLKQLLIWLRSVKAYVQYIDLR